MEYFFKEILLMYRQGQHIHLVLLEEGLNTGYYIVFLQLGNAVRVIRKAILYLPQYLAVRYQVQLPVTFNIEDADLRLQAICEPEKLPEIGGVIVFKIGSIGDLFQALIPGRDRNSQNRAEGLPDIAGCSGAHQLPE